MRARKPLIAVAVAVAAMLVACGDDASGPSNGLVRITFNSSQSACAGFLPGVATVTELWGPSGATLANTTPGEYMIKGTYNLPPGSGYSNIEIDITFNGSVVTASGGESVPQVPFHVPAGSLQGSFEARGGFLSRSDGDGRPGVLVSSGSSVLDCRDLH